MTNEEMIDYIGNLILEGSLTIRSLSEKADVSYSFARDTIIARKSVSGKLARALGYRRVVRFERLEGETE